MVPRNQRFLERILGSKSIRMSFALSFMFQLLLATGLIGFFLLQGSKNVSHLMLEELQQQMFQQVSDQLTQRMSEALQLNQINYDSFQSGILDLESITERERYFSNHLKSFSDVAMTYIGLSDGSFYGARRISDGTYQTVRNNSTTGGNSWYYSTTDLGEGIEKVDEFPNYDPRMRPWYIKAQEVGKPTFSDIYSHFVFHEPTVTASYPVYDQNNQLIGVFGVDYLLSWLGTTIGNLPIGKSGQVFVTDDKGYLIAMSFDGKAYEMIDNKSQLILAKDKDNSLMQAASTLPLDGDIKDRDLKEFKIDGKKYYVDMQKFEDFGTNWKIYLILAEDDFLGSMKDATRQTIVVIIFSILFFIGFAIWTSHWVTKPILSLNQAAKELTQGKLMLVEEGTRKDELGELSRSFNIMGKQLSNLVANLEKEVDGRTLQLQERNETLQRLSFLDGLTGIANRRKFDSALESDWNLALRHHRPLALIMLDIDFFKNYNDTYGHLAGDDCLRSIGNLLTKKVQRLSDLVARYGGEEFVIIVQETELAKVVDFANEIRNSVQELEIEHTTSPFKKVTLSIGVANMIPTKDTSPTKLIEMADQALYEAKNTGRNRVALSTTD